MKKRIFLLVCSFVVIYIINFFIPRMMPGNPFSYSSTVSGEETDGMSKEQLESLKAYYGLDKPIMQQFKDTIERNLKGDLGESIYYKKSVTSVLLDRMPWTLYIMFSTLFISMILGVILALIGINRKKLEKVIYIYMSFISEIPSFLIGIVLLFLVAAKVKWIPLSGAVTPFASYKGNLEYVKDIIVHSIMPIMAMVIVTVPKFYFTARASFLSVIDKLYVLNAKAKGLNDYRIKYRYILRNSITPIVARFFLSVGSTVGGTILIENVFAYPGLGRVLREAVMYRDYIMIQGVFLLSTILVLFSMFVADILNSRLRGGNRG